MDRILITSFILLIISAFISLVMVIPKNWEIKGNTDLQDKRNHIIDRILIFSTVWFILWTISIVFGICAVLN